MLERGRKFGLSKAIDYGSRSEEAASNVGPYGLFWQPALVRYYHRYYKDACLLEDQGTQERSGLFHSRYTESQTRASRARKSSVTHKSAITDHVIDWDKAKLVDREAQRQTRWIKEALWIRKKPMCMNRDTGSYQLSHTWDQVISRSRVPSSCKQSKRDQHCH